MIRLMIKHRPLASALRITLQSHLGREVEDGGPVASGDVLIATTMDASPDDCRALSGTGALMLILTPLCTDTESFTYTQAGVSAYLEMTADVPALIDALRSAASAAPVLHGAGC
ncbi:MAG: hypothetical protein WD557_12690 [Dehalococcoidia bacterium]